MFEEAQLTPKQIAFIFNNRWWSESNWIYLMGDPRGKFVKVGFTTQIRSRLKTNRQRFGKTLELLNLFAGTEENEKQLHKMLSSHRVGGIWKRPSEEVYLNCPGVIFSFREVALAVSTKTIKGVIYSSKHPECLYNVTLKCQRFRMQKPLLEIDPEFCFTCGRCDFLREK